MLVENSLGLAILAFLRGDVLYSLELYFNRIPVLA